MISIIKKLPIMIRFRVKLIVKKYKNSINKQEQQNKRYWVRVRGKIDRKKYDKNLSLCKFFCAYVFWAKVLLRAIWHLPYLSLITKKS